MVPAGGAAPGRDSTEIAPEKDAETAAFAVVPDLRESDDLETLKEGQVNEYLGFKPFHLTAEEDGSVFSGAERLKHEWTIWQDIKLPDGKIIVPGVVSHATNIVEHPELVAERICIFASAVGKENVIAGTDCGLGSRLHEDLVWAKLSALIEGARLASAELEGELAHA